MKKLAVVAFVAALLTTAGCAAQAPWTPPPTTTPPPAPTIAIVAGPEDGAAVTDGQTYAFTATVQNAPANSRIEWRVDYPHPWLGSPISGTVVGDVVASGASATLTFEVTVMEGIEVGPVVYVYLFDDDGQFRQFDVARDSRSYTVVP